jgi:hypothetical protein
MRRLTSLAVATFVLFSFSFPGQSQTQPGQQPKPIPIEHLYYHFPLCQHHLDKVAAERQKQGKDGE